MFSYSMRCPTCLREADFVFHKPEEYWAREPVPLMQPRVTRHEVRATSDTSLIRAYAVSVCPKCGAPVLVHFECQQGELMHIQQSAQSEEWRYSGSFPKIIAIHPQLPRPDDSAHYPEKLRRIYVELQQDLLDNRDPAGIVSKGRSVLEVALTQLGYDKDKGSLSQRIDQALADGLITKSLCQWAHHVRTDGNEAIHELAASKAEAADLVDFLKLFMEVVFVLPKRIPDKQTRAATPHQSKHH